jgi:hypothetical protein
MQLKFMVLVPRQPVVEKSGARRAPNAVTPSRAAAVQAHSPNARYPIDSADGQVPLSRLQNHFSIEIP